MSASSVLSHCIHFLFILEWSALSARSSIRKEYECLSTDLGLYVILSIIINSFQFNGNNKNNLNHYAQNFKTIKRNNIFSFTHNRCHQFECKIIIMWLSDNENGQCPMTTCDNNNKCNIHGYFGSSTDLGNSGENGYLDEIFLFFFRFVYVSDRWSVQSSESF